MSPAGDEKTLKIVTSVRGFMWIISLTVLSVVTVLITTGMKADKAARCPHLEFLPKWMFEHRFQPQETWGSPASHRNSALI